MLVIRNTLEFNFNSINIVYRCLFELLNMIFIFRYSKYLATFSNTYPTA